MAELEKIDKSAATLWGQLMRSGRFHEALSLALLVHKIANDQGETELTHSADSIIIRAAREIEIGHRQTMIPKTNNSEPTCSFCGQKAPKVRLGAGPNAFICNECVNTFHEIFDKPDTLK
jgi:RNA polymerase-binding transcription factor DksA